MAEIKFDDEGWLSAFNNSLARTPLEVETVRKFAPHAKRLIQRGLGGFGTAPRLTDVPFSFLTNDGVNAFAMPSKKYQFRITFFDGLLFELLRNLANAVMHPEMRDWIPQGIAPPDCATVLTIIAFEFLISHELAHIVNGHLALMMDRGLGFVMSEDPGDKRDKLENMDRQAFEMDADVTAAVMAFKSVMNVHREIRESALPEGMRVPYMDALMKDADLGIRWFFFAIARLFLLLGPDEHDLNSLEKLDHPPNYLRMLYIVQDLKRIYDRDFSGLIKTPFFNLEIEALVKSEKCLLSGQKGFSSVSHVRQMNDPRFVAHLARIRGHWQKVGPEVERFKLGGTRRRRSAM